MNREKFKRSWEIKDTYLLTDEWDIRVERIHCGWCTQLETVSGTGHTNRLSREYFTLSTRIPTPNRTNTQFSANSVGCISIDRAPHEFKIYEPFINHRVQLCIECFVCIWRVCVCVFVPISARKTPKKIYHSTIGLITEVKIGQYGTVQIARIDFDGREKRNKYWPACE